MASMMPRARIGKWQPAMLGEDGGKTWRITLCEGLRFNDGEEVLARDAVASLNRWAKRHVHVISSYSQVDELSAVSDVVLLFRLKRPFAPACRPAR
jgi:peptide/nickel transport system substrate-binding protein